MTMVAYDLNWRYRTGVSTAGAAYEQLLRELTVWCDARVWAAVLSQPLIVDKKTLLMLNRVMWQVKYPHNTLKRFFWQMYTVASHCYQRLGRRLSRQDRENMI